MERQKTKHYFEQKVKKKHCIEKWKQVTITKSKILFVKRLGCFVLIKISRNPAVNFCETQPQQKQEKCYKRKRPTEKKEEGRKYLQTSCVNVTVCVNESNKKWEKMQQSQNKATSNLVRFPDPLP